MATKKIRLGEVRLSRSMQVLEVSEPTSSDVEQ